MQLPPSPPALTWELQYAPNALVLYAVEPPAITAQPASRTNVAGTTATFSVAATGGALAYQWRKNGSALPDGGNVSGATAATLALSAVSQTDAASYTVVITNSTGSVTSSVAALTVNDPPLITSPPVSRTNNAGTTATFTVTATGTTPLSYQWKAGAVNLADGGNVSGASYTVVLTNAAGSVTSSVVTLTVIDPPTITTQPQTRTNNAGTTATFTVAATGTSPCYQWQKNGLPLANAGNVSGATSATLTLASVSQTDAATYTVVLTNVAGSDTSLAATLTVIDPPGITSQSASRTNNAGSAATFTVTATGTSPLSYQWKVGAVTGATTATLILTNVAVGDTASYTVVLTNPAGSVTSAVAVLTVTDPPVITLQPVDSTNTTGTATAFTVAATGGAPLRYQWYFHGTNPLAGATSATLSLTNIHRCDAGPYAAVVTNQYAAVTSAPATLTLQNAHPTANPDTFSRVAGLPLKIRVADVLSNDADPDEDTLSLAGVSAVTTNGQSLATNATHILYPNGPNVPDSFTYTASDGWGGAAASAVFITLTTNVFVQTITISNAGPSVAVRFAGVPGYDYELQRSTNLTAWVVLVATNAPASGIVQVTDHFADLGGVPPTALYRLRFVGYTP